MVPGVVMKGNIMENLTLGQKIGKVAHSLKITNSAKEAVTISLTFDFSGSTDSEIKSWLAGSRAIAFQRPTRALSADEIRKMDGTTIYASHAGQKVRSREEKIGELVSAGLPRGLAEMAVDNPAALEAAVASKKNDADVDELDDVPEDELLIGADDEEPEDDSEI